MVSFDASTPPPFLPGAQIGDTPEIIPHFAPGAPHPVSGDKEEEGEVEGPSGSV